MLNTRIKLPAKLVVQMTLVSNGNLDYKNRASRQTEKVSILVQEPSSTQNILSKSALLRVKQT